MSATVATRSLWLCHTHRLCDICYLLLYSKLYKRLTGIVEEETSKWVWDEKIKIRLGHIQNTTNEMGGQLHHKWWLVDWSLFSRNRWPFICELKGVQSGASDDDWDSIKYLRSLQWMHVKQLSGVSMVNKETPGELPGDSITEYHEESEKYCLEICFSWGSTWWKSYTVLIGWKVMKELVRQTDKLITW